MFYKFLRQHRETTLLFILGLIFFNLYLFLYIKPSVLDLPKIDGEPAYLVLNQPDESANYYFLRQFVLSEQVFYSNGLNNLALSQIHPRSMTVVDGNLAPIGFPGIIIIFGAILKFLVKVFGQDNFNLLAVGLTPLFAAITPLFFYGFLRRVFIKNIAWLSAAMLFFLPPWWYYASRPFQHNTLFVFFVVGACYFFVTALENSKLWLRLMRVFLLGLFFGLVVYIRPSEIVWLSFSALAGLMAFRKKWSWQEYLAGVSGLIFIAILFFATQIYFYGSILGSGYVKPDISGAAGSILSGPQGINFIKAIFLPFGFHLVEIFKNFSFYFVKLFGWWTLLAGWGLILIANQKMVEKKLLVGVSSSTSPSIGAPSSITPAITNYIFFFLIISLYILIFYGSWAFYDNLLAVPSIGTSYVRYFLPVFVFGLPFVAWYFMWLSQKGKWGKILLMLICFVVLWGGVFDMLYKLEGLVQIKQTVSTYYSWQARLVSLTKSGDIIITRYGDKYIFPLRQVIVGYDLPEQMQAMANLTNTGKKLWVYDLKMDEPSFAALEKKFGDYGLQIGAVIGQWENLELRPIFLKK